MIITYLHLRGYERLMLDGRHNFTMTLTAPLQIILGTNGSGKSSLVRELTPLPAIPADYQKNGCKIIKITHHGRFYVLTNDFSLPRANSFLVDDVEQNEGGTITVQRDLVKQHFGITADLHEFLLGEEPFDKMSPARRKEWFLRFSPADYGFAIKAYNRFKERHRDTSGALRVSKKQLVHESEKLIDSAEEAKVREQTKVLHEQLNFLIEHRKPLEKDPEVLRVLQEQLDTVIAKAAMQLENLLKQQGATPQSASDLQQQLEDSDQSIIRLRTLIEQNSSVLLKNQEKIEVLARAEQQSIEDLCSQVHALTARRDELQAQTLVFFPESLSAPTALDAFESCKTTLSEVFTTLPQNKLKRFHTQALVEAKENLFKTAQRKEKTAESLQRQRAKLAHLAEHKSHPDAQCPNCKHQFSAHFSQSDYDKLQAEVTQLEKNLHTDLLPSMTILQRYIDECIEYAQIYRQYTQCVNSWKNLQPYWDYLAERKIITDEPQAGLSHLQLIENDLRQQMRAQDLTHQISEKTALLESLRKVGGGDLAQLMAQNEELNTVMSELTQQLHNQLQRKNDAVQCRQRLNEIDALIVRVKNGIQKKRAANKDEIESIRRIEFNALVRQMQSALASRENVLNNLAMQKKVVDTITAKIAELEKEEIALAALVKQLSPTEGLIAEGLLGYIKSFVNKMNSVVKRVWTYPLVVQTCHFLEDASVELDYKFPLRVASIPKPVSDVCKGSTGMREIINLAFRMTGIRALGLHEHPVVLDEFARTLDHAHKSASVYLIKSLLEQDDCKQVFLISHDVTQYGALPNAQVCVLDDSNIAAPSFGYPVNAHVIRT